MRPFILACALAASRPAGAWSIDTSVTYGCHERWSQDALDAAGYAADPPALGDDRLLFESVDFDTSYLDRNIYALSLALGARSVDVGGVACTDLARLVGVQNDPDAQDMHCERSRVQDGEEGDAAAAESCREALRREALIAFEAAGPDEREDVTVNLLYQGSRQVPLSRFYFHMGRALHVLEDSFAHCFRTADRMGIVEVTNWIDDVSGRLDPDRDGPAHIDASDECRCNRPWGQPTYDAAVEASRELLALAYAPAGREAVLEAFLEEWMSHVPGCTASNGYCASPDPEDLAGDPCPGCDCSQSGSGPGSGAIALAVLLLVLARRRAW